MFVPLGILEKLVWYVGRSSGFEEVFVEVPEIFGRLCIWGLRHDEAWC